MSNEHKIVAVLLEVHNGLLYKDKDRSRLMTWGLPMPNGTPFPQLPPLPYITLNSIGYL